MARKKKRTTEKERREQLEQLERMVEALETRRHELPPDPMWDEYAREGRKILDKQKAADAAVESARKSYQEAKVKLDLAAREMIKTYGRRNLEMILAWLVANGQDETAEGLKNMLEHARMLLKRDADAKKKKRES